MGEGYRLAGGAVGAVAVAAAVIRVLADGVPTELRTCAAWSRFAVAPGAFCCAEDAVEELDL